MTQIPFFTIVIPTRDRPELFKDALESALAQEFEDFEVIVSDNSTDDKTQTVLEHFSNRPRLVVFRTNGNLPMPAHFEFATLKAHGRYVLMLTDRSVLKPYALNTIYNAINSSTENVSVCSWRWSLRDDGSQLEYADTPLHGGGIENLTSQAIAEIFVNRQNVYPYELPRAMNACYRNDLAAEIRNKYGALFFPISPDYTCAFLLLAHTEKVLFLDMALYISQGLSVSSGGKGYGSVSVNEQYLSTLGITDYFTHVPVKMPLVETAIFQDFLAIQKMAGGELNKVAMNWVEYFIRCHKEILEKRRQSIMSKQDVDVLQNAWDKALNTMSKDIRRQVKEQLHIQPLWLSRSKAAIKKMPFATTLIKTVKSLKQ